MEWTERPDLAEQLLAKLSLDREPKPLPHLTELIYCLTRSYFNRLKPLPPTSTEAMMFVLGWGLEDTLLRPHEASARGEKDGIHFEVDAVNPLLNPELAGLGELKTTRMAVTRKPEDFPVTWRKQLLGYLKCLDSRTAVFYVLYLIPAIPKSWLVTATQEEIDDNWDWILQRKEMYMAYMEAGEAPASFEYNEDWECRGCRYKLICDARAAKARRIT